MILFYFYIKSVDDLLYLHMLISVRMKIKSMCRMDEET